MFQLRFIGNDMQEIRDTPIASRQVAQAAFDSYNGSESYTLLCVELWQLVGGSSRCLDAYYFLTLADEPVDHLSDENDAEFDAACAEFYRTNNYT